MGRTVKTAFGAINCPICGKKNPVVLGLSKAAACIWCGNTFDLPDYVLKTSMTYAPKKPTGRPKKPKPKPRPTGRPKGKANYSDCLDIAIEWLVQAGACKHYPGYVCDKDYQTPGVCNKCLRQYFLKQSRERNRSKPIEIKRIGEGNEGND